MALSCPRVMESSPSCCILTKLSWISPPGGGANAILMVTKLGMSASQGLFVKGLRIQQGKTQVNNYRNKLGVREGAGIPSVLGTWANSIGGLAVSKADRRRGRSAMASDEEPVPDRVSNWGTLWED